MLKAIRQRQLRMSLDRTDFGILSLLQNNASLSNKQIAAAVGLAPSSAHERLKRLRDEGVLRGTHADVDPKAMGIGLEALFFVELSKHDTAPLGHASFAFAPPSHRRTLSASDTARPQSAGLEMAATLYLPAPQGIRRRSR